MGDPKKLKKKYSTPIHPWNKVEIDENRLIRREFGLRNRKELLIAESFLKKYKDIAKRLIADTTKQGLVEKKQMMDKLHKLGLISMDAELDDVLSLEIKDILERRLQSVIFRKSLARTMKQARQFITHRHVMVGDKEITAPSYIISVDEENKLEFKTSSSLADENHPEKVNVQEEIKKELEATKGKETKDQDKSDKVEAKETPKVEEKPAEEAKTEEKKEEAPKEEKAEEKPATEGDKK